MEEARKRLEQRFGGGVRTGGKGSVRRKRVKPSRAQAQEEATDAFKKQFTQSIQNLNNEVKSIACLSFTDYKRYTDCFVSRFTSSLGKNSRKSNRGDRPVEIRQKITQYLQIQEDKREYNTEIVEYATSQVNKETLESLLNLIGLLLEIAQEVEYQYFVTPEELTVYEKDSELDKDGAEVDNEPKVSSSLKPESTDVQLIKAYQRLKIDYSNPLTPLSLRTHYKKAIETEDRPEKLRKLRESYFVILRILPGNK